VRTALKSDDLQFWSAPTRLRRRAHTCRIAANDDESFCSHGVFLSLQQLFMIIRYSGITVC
jgi:hypothetical protein